jgi:hypothetical protein
MATTATIAAKANIKAGVKASRENSFEEQASKVDFKGKCF